MASPSSLAIVALTVAIGACARGDGGPAAPATAQDTEPDATAVLEPRSGSTVAGIAWFTERSGGVEVSVEITGAPPGSRGIHVHEHGDCSAADASSAGDHFAPRGRPHGPPGEDSHAGDLGNIIVDDAGRGVLRLLLPDVTVEPGPDSIAGRALIVHAEQDDLETQPTGDAGDRIACGVVEPAGR